MHIFLPSAHLSKMCQCVPFESITLYECVFARMYSPQRYDVSKAVLNNAESLRLATELTQWGLSAQDIPFCNVLCSTLVPSHTSTITPEAHADIDCPHMTFTQKIVQSREKV